MEKKGKRTEGKGREERILSTKTTSRDEVEIYQEISAKKKRGEVTLWTMVGSR